MIDLGFLTTNATKLSHFRHISRGSGVSISSFHERTFLASYSEPRINDREILLEESYKSALAQWKKAGFSEEAFFFFEDTSVAISAYSEKVDIPGPDVKYWMESMTFKILDRELRERGNNREVTVRSDLILHLPPSIRAGLGTEKQYLQFTGSSPGRIISKEIVIATNPLRPWQDSRSFNKWFVPKGESKPFSVLQANHADKHDFRKKAFYKLLEFLDSIGVRTRETDTLTRQQSLPGISARPPLFLVCGPSGAGKTTIAEKLALDFGYMHFEASDFMRRAFYERVGKDTPMKLSDFAALVISEEPWVVPEGILEYFEKFDGSPVVVTGFRSPLELESFENLYSGAETIVAVYIDAPREVRYERVRKRQRNDVPESKAAMVKKDREQNSLGLTNIQRMPLVKVIVNKSTKRKFYSSFEREFLGGYRGSIRVQQRMPNGSFSPLEEAIVLALGDQKKRMAYTTTELAKLVNVSNRRSFSTEKDNVSRYFNQRYSPFFHLEHDGRKARYSLSQTGRALCLRIMRSERLIASRSPPSKIENVQGELFS